MMDKRAMFVRGVFMVTVTTVLWGVLPIFLKMGLKEASPGSIAWFRFIFSFTVLYGVLSFNGSSPSSILKSPPGLGLLGGVALSANYFGMTQGIHFSGPSNAAILIQTASVFLVGVGVWVFRERLTGYQLLGMAVAGIGLYTFYIDQYGNVEDVDLYDAANLYILFAALIWAVYMICQKILSPRYGAQMLNLLVYGTAAIALIPLVEWSDFKNISVKGWGIMMFLGLNTLFAYGALAEAVKSLPLVLISIIITLNPLITLLGMQVMPVLSPNWLDTETIGVSGYLGGFVAVMGVVTVVAGQRAAGPIRVKL